MNKEVEELIKQLKETRDNPIYGEEGYIVENLIMFDGDKCKLLLDYINQLETNRDEAIAILEYYLIGNMKYEDSQEQFKRLKTTLERGKE